MEEECFPSEPVFVPRPGADQEDDGEILPCVLYFEMQHETTVECSNTSSIVNAL